MWRIFHFLFGWDYIQWRMGCHHGISRVRVNPEGIQFVWANGTAYELKYLTDVFWITCKSEKYIK